MVSTLSWYVFPIDPILALCGAARSPLPDCWRRKSLSRAPCLCCRHVTTRCEPEGIAVPIQASKWARVKLHVVQGRNGCVLLTPRPNYSVAIHVWMSMAHLVEVQRDIESHVCHVCLQWRLRSHWVNQTELQVNSRQILPKSQVTNDLMVHSDFPLSD